MIRTNRLQLKSRALFIDAFGGALDIRFSDGPATRLLIAEIVDIDRYRAILFQENGVQILKAGVSPRLRDKGSGKDQMDVRDQGIYDVCWCAKRVGGVFREGPDGIWTVQPHSTCTPSWWNDDDWPARVVGYNGPQVRDLLFPHGR